jgi:hypothetical protein
MTTIVTVAVLLVLVVIGYRLAIYFAPAAGVHPDGLGRRVFGRARMGLVIGSVLILGSLSFATWAIADGHTGLGVGTLVAVLVLSQVVLVPLHVRRSRRSVTDSQSRPPSVEK